MKKLKLLLVVIVTSIALYGCEESVKPINQYYALINELQEKMDIELIYICKIKINLIKE